MFLTAPSHFTSMLVVATPYHGVCKPSSWQFLSCGPRHCDCADDECCNLRFTSESKDDDSGGVVQFASLRVGVLSVEGSRSSGDNSSSPTQDSIKWKRQRMSDWSINLMNNTRT